LGNSWDKRVAGGINPTADKQTRLKPVAGAGDNLFQQVLYGRSGFESAGRGGSYHFKM
jgi:hypothetical protein